MKKLNAILDFNNLAMRALFTCQYMSDGEVVNDFSTDKECEILVRKITMDISHIIRTLYPDRVIFACDAKSPWRNDIYKDIDGETYKGNRGKDENKDWNKIFEAFNDLKSILTRDGFVVTEIDATEADDIAAMWKERIMSDGDCVALVSSDRDWVQLVDFDTKNNNFCVCYNPIPNNKGRKILYVDERYNEWVDAEDKCDLFFTGYDPMKKRMKTVESNDSRISIQTIDPQSVVLNKIMCGDDGDNVPAIYDYYKNGKKIRVTPLKASHIFSELNIKNVADLIESNSKGLLKNAIEKELKKDVDVDMLARVDRQRRLVELNSELFPKKIVESFEEHTDECKNMGAVRSDAVKMEDLLKDTKYIDKNYNKTKVNSVFDDFEALTRFSKSPTLF